MKHRIFRLLPAEARELQVAYLHCQHATTKIRYQAVRLYGSGYSVAQILDICACSRASLLEWVGVYRQRGITALLDHRTGGNRAHLKPEQIEALQNQLHIYTPVQLLGKDVCQGDGAFWTVADLACLLKRDYEITYQSLTSYRKLLAKCGFAYQRPTKQYKSHSDVKVMEFEETLEKIVDIAQNAPDTVILAQDEASLYLQASLMRVWSPAGQTPVVKVAANRDSTHFYGALNLKTGDEVTLRSDLMNAQVSTLFLNRVLLAYPDVPILLLWDRAPWHKGEAIRLVLAANPRLQLLYFPPGCPELNPQEHVWKATREAISHNHCRTNLSQLAEEFETHLKTTHFPCSLLDKHGYSEICPMFK